MIYVLVGVIWVALASFTIAFFKGATSKGDYYDSDSNKGTKGNGCNSGVSESDRQKAEISDS